GSTCRGGLRGGAICHRDVECLSGGKCAPEPVVWIGSEGDVALGGSDHIQFGPGNLVHTEFANVDGVRVADPGRRWVGGPRARRRCKDNRECGGAACTPPTHRNLMITGNHFLNCMSGSAALDLSLLPDGDGRIEGVMFSGNRLADIGVPFPVGVRMPSSPERAVRVAILGNTGMIAALAQGWNSANGRIEGNVPMAPDPSSAAGGPPATSPRP